VITVGSINGGVNAGKASAKFLTVKAGAAITKGQLVQWDFATAKDGITVIVAVANTLPVGVAMTNAASGTYFRVQTRGLGLVNLTTGNAAAANDMLYTTTAGAVADIAVGASTTDADATMTAAAIALSDDSGTTQTAGTYVITCPNSWWDDESISPVVVGTPSRKFITAKCGGDTIAVGSIVALSTVADDGITVVLSNASLNIPLGVALNAGTSGAKIRVQVKGLGLVPIVVDAVTAEGRWLIATDNGTALECTPGSAAHTSKPECMFGLALDVDTATALAAGDYIVTCPGSWWD
jgi:hypothetical protein